MKVLSCAEARNKKWYFALYYREVGMPQPLVIGDKKGTFGGGQEQYGQMGIATAEVTESYSSVQLYPGSRLMAMVFSDQPINVKRYASTLNSGDEVELVKPEEIVVVSDLALARDVVNSNGASGAGNADAIRRQLEVIEGKRKRFFG